MSSKNPDDREKRYSLRGHGSTEQLSQSSNLSQTDSSQTADFAKTPKMRQLKTHVDSPIPTTPRRSRRLSQDVSQENLEVKNTRPTTRRNSNLNSSSEIFESPARRRFTRASSVTSDEEDSISISSTNSRRVTRSRKSVAVIPTVVEEDSDENEVNEPNNALTLRNRSISKSPNVSATDINSAKTEGTPKTREMTVHMVDILKSDNLSVSKPTSPPIRKQTEDIYIVEVDKNGEKTEIAVETGNGDVVMIEEHQKSESQKSSTEAESKDGACITIYQVEDEDKLTQSQDSEDLVVIIPNQKEGMVQSPSITETSDQADMESIKDKIASSPTKRLTENSQEKETINETAGTETENLAQDEVSKLVSPVKKNLQNKSLALEETGSEMPTEELRQIDKKVETPKATSQKSTPAKDLQTSPLKKASIEITTTSATPEKQVPTPSKQSANHSIIESPYRSPFKLKTPIKQAETISSSPAKPKTPKENEMARQKSASKIERKREEIQDITMAEDNESSKLDHSNIDKMDISTVEASDMDIALKNNLAKIRLFSWNQSYIGKAGTKIDGYEREKSPEVIHAKISPPKSSKFIEDSEEEEFEEEEEEDNSLIDGEADDAGDDYQSGDSMCSETKQDLENNAEIEEIGVDLGAVDTESDSDEYETDDSFVVPDAESLDEDGSESDLNSEPESLTKKNSPAARKKMIVESSDSEENEEVPVETKQLTPSPEKIVPKKRKSIHEVPDTEKSPQKSPVEKLQKSAEKLTKNKRKLSEESPDVNLKKVKRQKLEEFEEADIGISQLFKTPVKPSKKSAKMKIVDSESDEDFGTSDLFNQSKDPENLNVSMKTPNRKKVFEGSESSAKKIQTVPTENVNESLVKSAKKSELADSAKKSKKKSIVSPNMNDNDSDVEQMEVDTSDSKPKKRSKSKTNNSPVKIEKILKKCNEYISGKQIEKKKFKALKKQRLEEKKKLKIAEEENEESTEENDNENSPVSGLKKKKKNKAKIKKQKLVAEVEDVKDHLSDLIKRKQELIEKRKQRKKEKKLAKKIKEAQRADKENLENQVPDTKMTAVKIGAKAKNEEKLVKSAKKNKEKIVADPSPKQKKTVPPKEKDSNKIDDSNKKNVLHKVDSNKTKKHMEGNTKLTAVENSNKKKNEVVEIAGTSKKRKFEELSDERVFVFKGAEQNEPKAKKIKSVKKLSVLEKIGSNNFAEHPKTPETKNKWGFKETSKTPPPPIGMKVSKLISKEILAKKLSKKKKTIMENIQEPATSLPRPVWTSSGTFLEESIEKPKPFKFDMDYVNLKSQGKTKFAFETSARASTTNKKKKQKDQVPAALDFKQSAIYRKGTMRDNSKKNLKFLGKS